MTPEQLELRRSGFGASEIAVIAGAVNEAVCRERFPEIIRSKIDPNYKPSPPNEAQERGIRLESAVLDWYRDKFQVELIDIGTVIGDNPIVIATPDALAFDIDADAGEEQKWLVEAKTCGWGEIAKQFGEPGTDQVPLPYFAQGQWQMLATRYKRVDLPVLLPGLNFEWYRIQENIQIQEGLLEAAKKAWRDYVLPRKMPPPNGSRYYDRFLAEKFPVHIRDYLEANKDAETVFNRYWHFREIKEAAEQRVSEYEQTLKTIIGEHEGLITGSGKITYRAPKPKMVVDYKSLCEVLHPDSSLIMTHSSLRQDGRRFVATRKKDGEDD